MPLFGFGHGHGYTTWAYESLTVADGCAVVTIRNSGARAGREVVQVYVGPDGADAFGAGPEGGPGAAGPVARRVRQRRGAPGRVGDGQHSPAGAQFPGLDDGWRTVPGRYTVAAAHSLDDPRLVVTVDVDHGRTVTSVGAGC